MDFWFEYFDGNAGTVRSFETAEAAISAAEDVWNHLSDNDRERYTSQENGACFYVSDDEGNFIKDWQGEA